MQNAVPFISFVGTGRRLISGWSREDSFEHPADGDQLVAWISAHVGTDLHLNHFAVGRRSMHHITIADINAQVRDRGYPISAMIDANNIAGLHVAVGNRGTYPTIAIGCSRKSDADLSVDPVNKA